MGSLAGLGVLHGLQIAAGVNAYTMGLFTAAVRSAHDLGSWAQTVRPCRYVPPCSFLGHAFDGKPQIPPAA